MGIRDEFEFKGRGRVLHLFLQRLNLFLMSQEFCFRSIGFISGLNSNEPLFLKQQPWPLGGQLVGSLHMLLVFPNLQLLNVCSLDKGKKLSSTWIATHLFQEIHWLSWDLQDDLHARYTFVAGSLNHFVAWSAHHVSVEDPHFQLLSRFPATAPGHSLRQTNTPCPVARIDKDCPPAHWAFSSFVWSPFDSQSCLFGEIKEWYGSECNRNHTVKLPLWRVVASNFSSHNKILSIIIVEFNLNYSPVLPMLNVFFCLFRATQQLEGNILFNWIHGLLNTYRSATAQT